jgi:hypothetical protein
MGFYICKSFHFPAIKCYLQKELWPMNMPSVGRIKSWILIISFLMVAVAIPNLGQGATYYISPSGSNSYDGLSPSSPWKTFGYAIPRLTPGDTLMVMEGTYSVSGGTGLPAITCGSNANNGTEAQPITIQAENERAALLQSTGDYHQAFYMNGCSYWNVIGLRGQSADLPPDQGGKPYSVFTIYKSDHITLQRLLAAYPNRYGNSQAIQVSESSDSLVEECEAYYFHRHGISIYRSNHITVRRSYVNSREYADIPGGNPSHAGAEGLGDEGLTLYQTTDSIVENCISEGNEFFGNSGQRNKYLGSMALNNLYGFVVGHHCCEEMMEAKDNVYINNVAVGSKYHGFLTQSDVNVFIDHLTSMNNVDYYGLYANNKYSHNRSSNPAVTWMVYPSLGVQNSLFLNNNIYGIRVNEDHLEDYAYRQFEYLNSYGHGRNYGPGLEPLKPEDVKEALSAVDPQMGSCIVFIPQSSPLKRAGKNGEDIGANILYRYENEILTSQALWDPNTGAFPCGAIVPGMNDTPGSSCFDVHQRLNVNANGCTLEMAAEPLEKQPPVISNVVSKNITSNEAAITWLTDEPADSQVEYGLSTSYGSMTSLDLSLTQSHSVALSGLRGDTTYQYRVRSKDAAGNLAVSGDYRFTTPPVNQSPVASDGAAKTTQGAPVSGSLSASDPDGDALTYSIVSNGGSGTVQITNPSTGTYTYTPKAGGTGSDRFTFKVNDGKADSNVATITVTINADSSSVLTQLRLVKGSSAYRGEGWDNVIDGDTQGWDGTVSAKSNPPYAIFAFADGSTKTVSRVRLMTDTGVGFSSRWVTQFTVQVSTTNTNSSSFSTVLNRVSKNGGAWQEYMINPTPAKYIKLIVNEPSSSYWKQVGEFEVYAH